MLAAIGTRYHFTRAELEDLTDQDARFYMESLDLLIERGKEG